LSGVGVGCAYAGADGDEFAADEVAERPELLIGRRVTGVDVDTRSRRADDHAVLDLDRHIGDVVEGVADLVGERGQQLREGRHGLGESPLVFERRELVGVARPRVLRRAFGR
jgi:hypothetical protein